MGADLALNRPAVSVFADRELQATVEINRRCRIRWKTVVWIYGGVMVLAGGPLRCLYPSDAAQGR